MLRNFKLEENGGISGGLLLLMAVVSGLAVANLYYSQPLLELMRLDMRVSEVQANLITVITQAGYAAGLFLLIPLGDMYPRRALIILSLFLSAFAALLMAVSQNIFLLWAASLLLGICSITPQFFIPAAGQFSPPRDKARNMGIVLGGLLTGVLASRAFSGFIGETLGWRAMFVIAALVMLLCAALAFAFLPDMKRNFNGSYVRLMASMLDIVKRYPRIRVNSIRAAFSFASMLAVWAVLAFHIAQEPFNAGADAVGILALCGVVGILVAGISGKYIPKYGENIFCTSGALLQMFSWGVAYVFADSYVGLALAIILMDMGLQFQQLTNQSGCIREAPSAANRVNTVFMTTYFMGGAMGTFCAGIGWKFFEWGGVCFVGFFFASVSALITLIFKGRGPRKTGGA